MTPGMTPCASFTAAAHAALKRLAAAGVGVESDEHCRGESAGGRGEQRSHHPSSDPKLTECRASGARKVY